MAARTELEVYRRQSMKAAKELYYGKDVVKDIKAAKSVSEIEQIMIAARKRLKD